jgi:hypothetical protein
MGLRRWLDDGELLLCEKRKICGGHGRLSQLPHPRALLLITLASNSPLDPSGARPRHMAISLPTQGLPLKLNSTLLPRLAVEQLSKAQVRT